MAQGFADIKIEGLKEFQRAARRSTDSDLPRRLGEAHRHIGSLVISRLTPAPTAAAVGVGAGAAVRPSASKRDVILRVGGAHRPRPPLSVWGKQRVAPVGRPVPPRPFIKGTVDRHQDEIGDAYLEAISAAMRGAFAKTDP